MQIRRLTDGNYSIDGHALTTLTDAVGAVTAVKKPIPVPALRIMQVFELVSEGNTTQGMAGDWLMQGVTGELYICPSEVFARSYEILNDKQS